MAVPPESIEVGKCYLTNTGRVWRASSACPMVASSTSTGRQGCRRILGAGTLMANALPADVVIEREVPCDWGAGADGVELRRIVARDHSGSVSGGPTAAEVVPRPPAPRCGMSADRLGDLNRHLRAASQGSDHFEAPPRGPPA
jgi:hypothetical protein